METPFVRSLPRAEARRTNRRVHAISLVGPATSAAGVIWAILQPYRVTLLHPRGETFWWLVVEPPLLVIVAGLVFALVVARPLITDVEARDASSG
jgi:hypothetical protein